MSKTGDYKIPFRKGNLLHYPDNAGYLSPIEWRDNYKFEATLVYKDYQRGRSSAILVFEDVTNFGKYPTYSMFMKDFNEVVPLLEHGKITGTWIFIKRGENYGIRLVKDK